MAAKPLKKPTGPKAPKKPTSRSKTGNPMCSEAASNWQLALRGKASLSPQTHATLGKCRALAATKKGAGLREASGKYSEQGRTALEGRLQKRFDSDLVTQKSRAERLDMLLKQRKAAAKPVEAKKPSAQLDVSHGYDSVRGSEIKGYAARITGTDPKYKLKREFLDSRSAVGPRDSMAVTVASRGLYENRYAGRDDRNRQTAVSDYTIIGRNKVREGLTKGEAERAAKLMERFRDNKAKPAPVATVAAAPAAPRLAPGRGTEERKALAAVKKEAATLIRNTSFRVSSSTFEFSSHSPEKRAKSYSDQYTNQTRSNMRSQLKRAQTANDARVVLGVLKEHKTGMESRLKDWTTSQSRTSNWAVTGAGNYNSSRNSKRMEVADRRQQEVSKYREGLENAVSRALSKKSDTGQQINRLATIRTTLEKRKNLLNRQKSEAERTMVYAAKGIDQFRDADRETRATALKGALTQVKKIDAARKTILSRSKKIKAAEDALKKSTRIVRATI